MRTASDQVVPARRRVIRRCLTTGVALAVAWLAMLQERSEGPFTVARRFCEIDQMVVDPARRREGVARALLLKALSEARAEGIREIEATSWSFNDSAHAMFRRLGFVPKTVRFELKGESS